MRGCCSLLRAYPKTPPSAHRLDDETALLEPKEGARQPAVRTLGKVLRRLHVAECCGALRRPVSVFPD